MPQLKARIDALIFKSSFSSAVESVKPDLAALERASSIVMSSKRLHAVLQAVLLAGNILNAGTFNGKTYGFKLAFLGQLRNTKTSDNSSTLLHFLAAVGFRHGPSRPKRSHNVLPSQRIEAKTPELFEVIPEMKIAGEVQRRALVFSSPFCGPALA